MKYEPNAKQMSFKLFVTQRLWYEERAVSYSVVWDAQSPIDFRQVCGTTRRILFVDMRIGVEWIKDVGGSLAL